MSLYTVSRRQLLSWAAGSQFHSAVLEKCPLISQLFAYVLKLLQWSYIYLQNLWTDPK